jgi:KDO transferase-3
MDLITRFRKKIRRLRTPPALSHMKSLHPDFSLARHTGDSGHDARWKRRAIGRVQHLSGLEKATTPACFIVASGPSLGDLDLRRLQGQACFGVNGSVVKAAEAGIPFRYHVILDRSFVRDRLDLVKQAIHSGGQCVFSFTVLNEIAEREPALLAADNLFLFPQINAIYGESKRTPEAFDAWASGQQGVFLHPAAQRQRGWVGFSKREDLGFFSGQTVVFSALQLAYWLGFRRIFILGMDLGGPGGGFARFYEGRGPVAKTRLDRDFEPHIVPSFQLAGEISRREGWEIYNVSPSSRLPTDIIPKLEFEQALALCGA